VLTTSQTGGGRASFHSTIIVCIHMLLFCLFLFSAHLVYILADIIHRRYAWKKNRHCRQLGQQHVCLYFCAII